MAFLIQVWILMSKNFRILLFRQTFRVFFMGFLLPIVLAVFFSFARNLFVPPSTYGFGQVRPVKGLAEAFGDAYATGRHKVVLIDNGHTGGDIERVLDQLAEKIEIAAPHISVLRAHSEDNLAIECRSSLRGVTACFNAVVMRSSPNEGDGGHWNYTLRTDAEMWSSPFKIRVDRSTNPEEIYLLPTQRAIDSIIAGLRNPSAAEAVANNQELAFTSLSQKEHNAQVKRIFHRAIVRVMGVAFLSIILWIVYHLAAFVATERETGMSQLIDAMMPASKPWMPLAARIISSHLSFSAVYAPAWIIASVAVHAGVFTNTSLIIVLLFYILGGFAVASLSILFGSFFKRAQLSAIVAIISISLLGILTQTVPNPTTDIVVMLSAFFTPCTFVYFIKLMSRFEMYERPTDLFEIAPDSQWRVPGIVFLVLLCIQIFAYPLIAAFVEKGRHSVVTEGRKIRTQQADGNDLGDNAVQLNHFTKTYPPKLSSRLFSFGSRKPEPVTAVKDLSLSVRRGQIVVLLGANGSGKSTTLEAIAGLSKLTSGSITIDGTGGIGIAPQRNVFWDSLTVEEHLQILGRLKSPDTQASKDEILETIKSIDLFHKRKAYARTLSGGQKRKLQLGMMLVGGSSVCCVDEISSGIDPLSRRKLWDILLAERGKRTLIITTHFLDEADLLADHIAILSKGTLRAEGSSVELKDRIGGGYRIHVHKDPGVHYSPNIFGVTKKDAFDQISYTAPTSNLAAQVIKELQIANITNYRFSGPTIEDVFLKLAEEIKDEEAFRIETKEKILKKGIQTTEKVVELDSSSQDDGIQRELRLLDGRQVSYLEQTAILIKKRWIIFRRNWAVYLIAFLLPILAAGLTSLFVMGRPPIGCKPGDQTTPSETQDAFTQMNGDFDPSTVLFLAGPRSKINQTSLTDAAMPILMGGDPMLATFVLGKLGDLKLFQTFQDFQDFAKSHTKNVTTGLWLGDDESHPTIAWVGNLAFTSSLTAQQFLDTLLTHTTIQASWAPFDLPFNPGLGKALNLVIYMGLALTLYPAFFALYPSHERRKFVRSLQYSNGVRPLPLWIAYVLFDFLVVLFSAGAMTAVWAGLSDIWFHIEYVFVVLFLYGLASILLAYIMSLFAKSQLSAFAWAACAQDVLFLGYLIAYICIMTYLPASKIDSVILLCHFIISAFLPIGSAMRALFITTNLFSSACDGTELTTNPAALTKFGGPILYLVVQSGIMFGLLLWFDGGSAGSSVRSLFNRIKVPEKGDERMEQELVDELTRVTTNGHTENGLRVLHVTKSFGRNTAVDNVTFGIKRGEVFALLGPNGAGKSTTISLIRGDMKPSLDGGDIYIEGISVTKNLAAARANLGVCPQIDALDQLTVREHLEFYARIRGIPNIQHNVTAVLQAVGLSSFSKRMASDLSGGNKRKLSLGIALMGNPGVLLLDEPSSGLDAASKRIMWKTLEATVPGRSILLTTHSMEEADALAGRIGILARRMLALGTPDDLRHRFGDALHVHLVLKSAPRTTDAEMEQILGWIRKTLPTAIVDPKMYHGQMRFSVRAGDVLAAQCGLDELEVTPISRDLSQSAIGRLVILLEENKSHLGVEYYSLCPTTLDQVFLSIVGRHNVQEENSEQ